MNIDLEMMVKLEQLRQDIRKGVESGEPTPWDAEEIKQAGRQRRANQRGQNDSNSPN